MGCTSSYLNLLAETLTELEKIKDTERKIELSCKLLKAISPVVAAGFGRKQYEEIVIQKAIAKGEITRLKEKQEIPQSKQEEITNLEAQNEKLTEEVYQSEDLEVQEETIQNNLQTEEVIQKEAQTIEEVKEEPPSEVTPNIEPYIEFGQDWTEEATAHFQEELMVILNYGDTYGEQELNKVLRDYSSGQIPDVSAVNPLNVRAISFYIKQVLKEKNN